MSECCAAPIINGDICSDCKEHTGIIDDELCAECKGEEVGFGPDSDLCCACDNENRNPAMEGIDQYAEQE